MRMLLENVTKIQQRWYQSRIYAEGGDPPYFAPWYKVFCGFIGYTVWCLWQRGTCLVAGHLPTSKYHCYCDRCMKYIDHKKR